MSQIEIKSAESAIRTSLEAERNAQHQLVDDAYKAKRNDTTLTQEENIKVRAHAFDLK